MRGRKEVLDILLNAPLRIIEWQFLSKHPELYSRKGISYLKGESKKAWEDKDFKRIQELSSKILLFEQCFKMGAEKAFFGRKLDDELRSQIDITVDRGVTEKIKLSKDYEKTEKWDEAIHVIEHLTSRIKRTDNQILHAELQRYLGMMHWKCPKGDRAGNLDRSISLYRTSLNVFTRESFPEYWAMITNNLANTYLLRIRGDRVKNLEKAMDLLQASLEVRTREAFPEFWASAQNNIAVAYSNRIRGDRAENLERAIEFYKSSLEVRTIEAFPEYWAMTQSNLANTYLLRIRGDREENLERAIELYRASLEVRTRDAFPELWAQTQSNMANTYMNRISGNRPQNLEMAIELFKKALEVFTHQAHPEYWAVILYSMATAYVEREKGDRTENLEHAIELFKASLEVRTREAFPEYWARTHDSMAKTHIHGVFGSRKENLKKAIELYNAALEVRTPLTFPAECRETAIGLSEAQIRCRRWEEALETAHLARQADRLLQRQATSIPGKTYEIEESAILYYHASLASAHLDNIIGAVEWLEQGKTRELGESLARDRAIFADDLREEDIEQYLHILEKIRLLEAEQRGVVPGARSFTEVAEEVREVHNELDRHVKNIQIYISDFLKETAVSCEEIESLLQEEGIAYVLMNVTRYGTVMILLTKLSGSPFTETFFIEDFTTATMEEVVGKWSRCIEKLRRGGAVTTRGRKEWWGEIDNIGRQLYRDLFNTIHEWLKEKGEGIRELLLVPHLSLHVLPFHLARFDVQGGSKYLIEEYQVSYAPSITVILAQRGLKEASYERTESRDLSAITDVPPFLAVCNPTEDLNWSQEEVRRIEKFFVGPKRILQGKKATKETLVQLATGARFLHLSCHGEFDSVQPWNSGLVLSRGRGTEKVKEEELLETVCTRDSRGGIVMEVKSFQDGSEEQVKYDAFGGVRSRIHSLPDGQLFISGKGSLLPLKEVFSTMDLSTTELVVLSACESGLVSFGGKSDEFVGLPGGFLRAGASNVIASLWVVDDRATAYLMENFYRNLFEYKLSPAKALRKAQLEIKKKPQWKNPFYWGAFRILGE
jgi:CHAT domain-containing protein/tetratricopeptide (TPR) repeat protein